MRTVDGIALRILGPVELLVDGEPIYLARRQQRLLLGILGMEANHLVSQDRLIDLIWGSSPPRHARAVLQTRVSEMRSTLSRYVDTSRLLLTRDTGYMLQIDPAMVDLYRFRDLVRQAQRASSDETSRRLLRTAIDLWRGPALGGWLPADSHTSLCAGIEAARLTASEDLWAVELKLGNHHMVVDEIAEIARANPGRERLISLTMAALHRTGRTAEALRYFEQCRRWLASELGVDPGPDLRALHVAMLGGETTATAAAGERTHAAGREASHAQRDSTLPTGSGGPTQPGFVPAVPRLLPAATPDFAGRDNEAGQLRDQLTADQPTVRLVLVTGPAGVGKTALSVHVAHGLRDHFSDGQLYADLHGADPRSSPATSEILARFLRAFGVSNLLDEVDERATLYRNLLAGRKVLVVLDNVRDADQVRALIPGGPTCAVLINSRARIGAAIGAISTNLGVLDHRRAIDLLTAIAGPDRVNQEPQSAARMIDLCGGLPLAIRIVAARLNAKPHWTMRQLHERLADERRRLDQLAYGDLDVRASLTLSYAGLSRGARTLLCRLGDIDIPDVNLWTSTALLGHNTGDAEEALEELYDAQLLDVAGTVGGYHRYRMHDLVRLFAREHAESDQAAEDLTAARERVYGAWLHLVDCAYTAVYGEGTHGGGSENITSPAPRYILDHDLTSSIAADPVAWIHAERVTVTAIVRRCALDDQLAACWGIACTSFSLLEMGRHFDDCRITLDTARDLLADSDDRLGLAAVLYRLGSDHANRKADQQALQLYRDAADLFRKLDDQHGHAMAILYVAIMYRRGGNRPDAMRYLETAIHGLAGVDDGGHAFALHNVAQLEMSDGNFGSARRHLDHALILARRSRSRRREAQVLFHQGMLELGEHRANQAEQLFIEVLELVRTLGDLPGEIQALRGIALCHHAAARAGLARATLQEALALASQPSPTLMEETIRTELRNLG